MPRGRKSNKAPERAMKLGTYKEIEELVSSFADGKLSLLVILGRPGLSKSQTLKRATKGKDALLVRGRWTAISFFMALYFKKDKPVVIDDPDNLLSDKLNLEYVKLLTETDEHKRLDWRTRTKILAEQGVPDFFHTTSPVCIITNSWSSDDPIFQALESRAEFVSFEPTWEEMYKQVATWFWDQEIFDYVLDRIQSLKEPDCRIFTKAYDRKMAGLKMMSWQRLIDDHCDDEFGLCVRRLLDDSSFSTNTERVAAFIEMTGADRATFYRRLKEFKKFRPTKKPDRIVLTLKTKPSTPRPADGQIEGTEDDEGESDGDE